MVCVSKWYGGACAQDRPPCATPPIQSSDEVGVAAQRPQLPNRDPTRCVVGAEGGGAEARGVTGCSERATSWSEPARGEAAGLVPRGTRSLTLSLARLGPFWDLSCQEGVWSREGFDWANLEFSGREGRRRSCRGCSQRIGQPPSLRREQIVTSQPNDAAVGDKILLQRIREEVSSHGVTFR